MHLYSYVITRDYGFAPNPFWNICSLATCKPQIRERALKGDWVTGFGGANTAIARKMVFLMRVDEVCTFDEYWEDSRFLVKRPCFDGNYQQCYEIIFITILVMNGCKKTHTTAMLME